MPILCKYVIIKVYFHIGRNLYIKERIQDERIYWCTGFLRWQKRDRLSHEWFPDEGNHYWGLCRWWYPVSGWRIPQPQYDCGTRNLHHQGSSELLKSPRRPIILGRFLFVLVYTLYWNYLFFMIKFINSNENKKEMWFFYE